MFKIIIMLIGAAISVLLGAAFLATSMGYLTPQPIWVYIALGLNCGASARLFLFVAEEHAREILDEPKTPR